MRSGVDLHGVCLYPVLGMYDWKTTHYLPMGVWNSPPCGLRIPDRATLAVMKRWDGLLEAPRPSQSLPRLKERYSPEYALA